MHKILLNGCEYLNKKEETVLNTLLRNGIDARFSCGKGICHTCMMKQTNGNPPINSQKELSEHLASKNYFLPCICKPASDMAISAPDDSDIYMPTKVVRKHILSENICQLLLEIESQYDYHPGQFVNIRGLENKLTRPFSLASTPLMDVYLEFHIKKVAGGKFSHWVFDELKENDCLEIQSAQGDCYYNIEDKTKDILLIGTGSGLAPLYGIIKDALLLQSHLGDIYLYHGSRSSDGLYLTKELKDLEKEYSKFHYFPCVSGQYVPSGYEQGRADDIALMQHSDLSNIEIYVCGLPDMVNSVKEKAASKGVKENAIHADPFEFSERKKEKNQSVKTEYYAHREEKFRFPEVNLKMWAALGNGNLLTEILTDFYDKVYNDAVLSPYFTKVAKDRVRQKQYSFMYQLLTGENVYLGDKPRNAHHWMVISDEIFDHREKLIEDSMRKFKLPEMYIKVWLDLDESYRELMVKSKPWDKIQDGIVIPVDGFKEVILDAHGICDYCHEEIFAGDTVRYHLHEAKVYCKNCMGES